jgi:hypothetical protein
MYLSAASASSSGRLAPASLDPVGRSIGRQHLSWTPTATKGVRVVTVGYMPAGDGEDKPPSSVGASPPIRRPAPRLASSLRCRGSSAYG